jgi:hypothetical protein
MSQRLLRPTVWLLLFSVPMALTAQAVPAILNVQGSANVNGSPVPGHGNLFPGDRLQTMAGSNANITGDGMSVSVPENSSVVFGDNKLDLSCGGTTVSTVKGSQIRSVGLVVKPATNTAKFSVFNTSEGLTIAPSQGSVTVDDGKGQPITVEQGQSFTRKMNTGCNPIQNKPPGSVVPLGAGILAAAGAAAIAYCTVGDACRSKKISPETPAGP